MCSSGIGTSELLKMKVKQNFPNLEIVDVISHRLYKRQKEKYADVDLILSSIKLEQDHFNVPILLVSAILSRKDILAINEILKEC